MAEEKQNLFEILRGLAIAGSHGEELRPTTEAALILAAESVGLQAAAMYLWDAHMNVTLAVTHATSEAAKERLVSIEEGLFSNLRKEQQLLSAYMSFGGENPGQSFTMPLRHSKTVFGAIVGIGEGEGRLVSEDFFLEAFTAAIALNVIAAGAGGGQTPDREIIDKERLGAIIETAITVNHEINNPLTAILGNIQLLLLHRKDLDEEITAKLRTMESSAMKIKDVTQRLLRVSSARTVEYSEGTTMLDLSGTDDDEKNKPG